MIFGISMPKALPIFFLSALGILTPAFSKSVLSIEEVMALISVPSEGQVGFTETKQMPFLKEPLETSGLLSFRKPAFFSKQIQRPRLEQYDIDQDTVFIRRAGEEPLRLQLTDSKELSALTAAIRGPLLGDRALLERFFTLHLGGQINRWTLILSPKDAEVASVIQEIKIQGQNDQIREILMREPDGSLSTLRLKYHP
jgi:hypothetical protein